MKVGAACEESETVFKIHLVTVTVFTLPSDSLCFSDTGKMNLDERKMLSTVLSFFLLFLSFF